MFAKVFEQNVGTDGPLTHFADAIKSPASELLPRQITGKPVFTVWDTKVAIDDGYLATTWVYACIQKRLNAVSSIPMVVQKQGSNGNWEQVKSTHPLNQLLQTPNPYMTLNELHERLIMQLDLGGNSILNKVKTTRNVVKELWFLDQKYTRPVPDQRDWIKHYQYNNPGAAQKRTFENDEIIHFQYPSPENPFWGVSPLMAGGKTVDIEVEAMNWNKASMQNRAVPDGMLSAKTPLTQEQFEKWDQSITNNWLGRNNAHRPIIASFDVKYEKFAFSPSEMDYIETRKLGREELATLFGVPPAMLGIMENATLSNFETSRVMFYRDTISPILRKLESVWNTQLVPDFGDDLRVIYDTTQVQAMQSDVKEKLEIAKLMFGIGIPLNDIIQRLELGFDEFENGDIGYLPTNLIPTIESDQSTVQSEL